MKKGKYLEQKALRKFIKGKGLYVVEDVNEYAECMEKYIEGYATNPIFNYICGGEFNKEICAGIFKISVSAMGENSVIYADSKEMNACAVWFPSGAYSVKLLDFFRCGGSDIIKLGGFSLVKRIIKYELYVSALKGKQTNHNDWYLFSYENVANKDTDEMLKLLISPAVEFAWKNQRAIYAECAKPDQLAACRKIGFHISDQKKIPGTDITLSSIMV